MTTGVGARKALIELVREWDESPDAKEHTGLYRDLLEEILFHGEERFSDYRPSEPEGPFVYRLLEWLRNVAETNDRQLLLGLLRWLVFVDQKEMDALYRDAYRRILFHWVCERASISELLSPTFEFSMRRTIAEIAFVSITLSFSFPTFTQINDLTGIPDPMVLGPEASEVPSRISANSRLRNCERCVIFEDFVGSGKQAGKIVNVLRQSLPRARLAFIPLIALEDGVRRLRRLVAGRVDVLPVLTIRRERCLGPRPKLNEPAIFASIREVVKATESRVLPRANELDDPPEDAFGYKKTGALVVTFHNSPNNTLPLIHHKAPLWNALFRRHHHLSEDKIALYKDGLR